MWESSVFIFIIITIIINNIPSDTLESDRLNMHQEVKLSPGLNRCEIYQPESRGLMHSRPWLEGTESLFCTLGGHESGPGTERKALG